MGKKYIIELESGTHIFVLGPEGIVHIGEPDVVYETVDGMQIGDAVINAKPYAEPDLGALAKENFERGYRQRKAEDEKEIQEVYQRGLSDAWEAARKIWKYDTTTLRAIFGEGIMRMDWFMKFTASECIEKIRQYEQRQEEIKVGDEVEGGDEKYIVLQKYLNNIDEHMVVLFNRGDGEIRTWHLYNGNGEIFKKTGRHFPEIAEVMQKMKEEQKQK